MKQSPLQHYYQKLDECMLTDRQGFFRRLQKFKKAAIKTHLTKISSVN